MSLNTKPTFWIEKLLLINISIFVLFGPLFERVPKITAAVTLVLLLFLTIGESGKKFYRHVILQKSFLKPLVIFMSFILVSVIFSLDPYHSQQVFFERYIYYILFFITGGFLAKNHKSLNVFLIVLALAGILLGVGSLYSLRNLQGGRLFYCYARAIDFNSFLVLMMPVLFSLWVFSKDKAVKYLSMVSLGFLCVPFLFTASRATWGAVLFVLFLISFLKKRKFVLLFLTLFLIASFVFLPDYFWQRAETTFNPNAWGDRVELWRSALSIFQDFPVFGAGLGMYAKILVHYQPSLAMHHSHAHQAFLELLSESGVMGLGSFLLLIGVYFRLFLRGCRQKNLDGNKDVINLGFAGAVLSSLVLCFSGSVFIVGLQDGTFFWLMFGMACFLVDR